MLPLCDRHVCVSRTKYLPSHNRGILVPKEPATIGGHLRRRRLQLKILQREAARRLRVSKVTLSRWERDTVYPTWSQQPKVIEYLAYNPFTDPALGHPGGNKPSSVAFLSFGVPANIGQRIVAECIRTRKTREEFARMLGLSPKTIWNWVTGRRRPSGVLLRRVSKVIGNPT